MSVEYASKKSLRRARVTWSSASFIVESILLLLFLVASLAVLTQVFSASLTRSVESRTLDAASIAATSIAEHFAADPTSVEEKTQLGDLLIKCEVTEENRPGGIMYHAKINVYDLSGYNDDAVYSVETSSYQSGGGDVS